MEVDTLQSPHCLANNIALKGRKTRNYSKKMLAAALALSTWNLLHTRPTAYRIVPDEYRFDASLSNSTSPKKNRQAQTKRVARRQNLQFNTQSSTSKTATIDFEQLAHLQQQQCKTANGCDSNCANTDLTKSTHATSHNPSSQHVDKYSQAPLHGVETADDPLSEECSSSETTITNDDKDDMQHFDTSSSSTTLPPLHHSMSQPLPVGIMSVLREDFSVEMGLVVQNTITVIYASQDLRDIDPSLIFDASSSSTYPTTYLFVQRPTKDGRTLDWIKDKCVYVPLSRVPDYMQLKHAVPDLHVQIMPARFHFADTVSPLRFEYMKHIRRPK